MEAVIVRTLFTAYGIPVLISGENNGRLFGSAWPFGTALGSLQIEVFVNRAHAEDAAALLAAMRGFDHVSAADDDLDGTTIGDPRGVATGRISEPRPLRATYTHRWSDTALALLLATVLGFGAAHLYYLRPWRRGAALAVAQLGVFVFFTGPPDRFAVVFGIARLVDVLGVLHRIWSAAEEEEEVDA